MNAGVATVYKVARQQAEEEATEAADLARAEQADGGPAGQARLQAEVQGKYYNQAGKPKYGLMVKC